MATDKNVKAEKDESAYIYRVTAPSAAYNGKTLGVQFQHGSAIIDARSIDPRIELTPKQVAERMVTDWGYTVEPIGDTPALKVTAARPARLVSQQAGLRTGEYAAEQRR